MDIGKLSPYLKSRNSLFDRFLRLASPMASFQLLLLLLLFADRSRVCRFFFPSGLQEKNFSEFMVTAGYRTESSILVGCR